ncbi:LuxR C-terminal-related transcriptional regulator [Arthrobacter hankyongi]|uniref:LuxR C-terminal-related transcriptional regulator n=1 Tax=Arthrobacter hankyongi TaxID=2904801 RepID=UPI0027E07660|nr:LuxR C-terminal-related transcriptional regulator [Arthrobacter hankyongi]
MQNRTTRDAAEAAGRTIASGLSSLCDAIAAAKSQQEIQDVCMALLPDMIEASAYGIYIFDNPGSPALLSSAAGVSDRFLKVYEAVGRSVDPVLDAVLSDRRPVRSGDLMSEEQWSSSPFFTDVLALHDMRVVLEAPLLYRGEVVGTLNFSDRDQDVLGSPLDYALLGTIGNLVGLAVGSIAEREGLLSERDQLLEAFELSAQAMVLSDTGTGRRRMNGMAVQILGELEPDKPEVFFEELMAAARTRDGLCQLYRCEVAVAGELRQLTLRNFPATPKGKEVLVSILQLTRPHGSPGQLPVQLSRLLSRREAEVAQKAVLGLGDEEIARRLFLSPYTVKQHLKAVYRKLGVRSRVELTRAVLTVGDPGLPQA